jgi:hypothetical protein
MKEFSLTIPKEEWSEKNDSKVFLFSRLCKGEIPDSPKYIRKIYDRLNEIKEEIAGMEFDFVKTEIPKPYYAENGDCPLLNKNLSKCCFNCVHNFLCICSHVFGNCNNGGYESKDDSVHFIISFKGESR